MAIVAAGAGYWYVSSSKDRNPSFISTASGISGEVLLGPTCPVMQDPPDPQCAEKAYKTRLAVTTPNGTQVIKEFDSDSNGKFRVEVSPGEYAIRSAAAANILPYCATNETVRVATGAYASTTVYCDTGIR